MRRVMLFVLVCFLSRTFVWAGTFEVDEHTLFLAHFDGGIDADYAKGNKEATGYANIEPNGKFGDALSARYGPMVMVDNYPRGYCPIGFEVKDNLNPKRGTFEMWVKTTFDPKVNAKNYAGYSSYYLFSIRDKEDRKLICYLQERDYRKDTRILRFYPFYHSDSDRKDESIISFIGETINKDEWTHLAVTWDEDKVRVFINGKGSKTLDSFNGNLYRDADTKIDKFYVGGIVIADYKPASSGSCANSLIDEIRISDIVRYKENFEVQR